MRSERGAAGGAAPSAVRMSPVAALRRLLAEAGGAALLVVARSARDPDLAPFVGGAHLGECLLIVPSGGVEPSLACFSPMEREEAAATGLRLLSAEQLEVARWARERPAAEDFLAAVMAAALRAGGVPSGRIALAGHAAAGSVYAACAAVERQGWSFIAGNDLLRQARKTKNDEEIAAARRAADGTCAALRRVAALLREAGTRQGEAWLGGERLRVARLRAEIGSTLARHGLEQPEGNIVAGGAAAGVPHNQGDPERVVRVGEALVVDLFPKGRLFADCTRTFCVGEAPEAVRVAHAAVADTLRGAHAAARAGVRGWDLQQSACARLAAAGYATPVTHPGTLVGYVHGLGHGVGYELHEYPSFRKESGAEGVLAEGDVFTLEPGLYDPANGYGVRLEDLCWLGPEGSENLTRLPYDLDPRAWGSGSAGG